MIEIKFLRQDIHSTAKLLKSKGFDLDVPMFEDLESERKALQTETESLQAERNAVSKQVGIAKSKGEDVSVIIDSMSALGSKLDEKKSLLEELNKKMHSFLSVIPNIPDASTPVGLNENDNKELRVWGAVRDFDFDVQNHIDLGENLAQMDFKSAVKLSGSRFVVMKGQLAKLHRALAQFMMDLHTEKHGYTEMYVPYLVNHASLFGTGQLPKFGDDLFDMGVAAAEEKNNLSLIPTAEVSLTNMVREQIVDADSMPLKMVAHTPCFRREAGSYGLDTKGLIRQHQFDKVELVIVSKPEESMDLLEQLTADAETVLQKLELPYRVVELCTGDLGFSACKTYDLEVWIPSQNCYREISSCSNMSNFQAARMKARFKNNSKKTEYVHTLNGSGLAVGRTLVAVLENYQQADGSILIPEVLRPYMNGAEFLR